MEVTTRDLNSSRSPTKKYLPPGHQGRPPLRRQEQAEELKPPAQRKRGPGADVAGEDSDGGFVDGEVLGVGTWQDLSGVRRSPPPVIRRRAG